MKLKRILRLLGYTAFFFLWLLIMALPCFAFALAARGELGWQRGEYNSDRVWLIQERDQKGLGYQVERIVSDQRASGGPVCVRNTAYFWLWEGAAEDTNIDYCECLAADGTVTDLACP